MSPVIREVEKGNADSWQNHFGDGKPGKRKVNK